MTKLVNGEVNLDFKPLGNLSDRSKLIISIFFIIFVLAESSFLFWQFGEIVQNKSAKDVSLTAFSILLGANIIWITYALVVVGSTPILLSGVLYVIGCSLIIFGRLYYGDGEEA